MFDQPPERKKDESPRRTPEQIMSLLSESERLTPEALANLKGQLKQAAPNFTPEQMKSFENLEKQRMQDSIVSLHDCVYQQAERVQIIAGMQWRVGNEELYEKIKQSHLSIIKQEGVLVNLALGAMSMHFPELADTIYGEYTIIFKSTSAAIDELNADIKTLADKARKKLGF